MILRNEPVFGSAQGPASGCPAAFKMGSAGRAQLERCRHGHRKPLRGEDGPGLDRRM